MSSTPQPPGSLGPGGFISLTQPPSSHFSVGNVPAPTNAYVPPDGFFRVNIQNTFTGANVIVTVRTMRSLDGVVTLSQDTLVPTNSGAVNTFFLPGVEGFILSATARTENLGLRRGQCFVSIVLCSGSQTDLHLQQILVQDYISQAYAAAWPGGSIKLTTEGPGLTRQVAGNVPALGTNLSDTVPTNRRWRLAAMFFNFAASAAVANRAIQVFIDDGTGTFVYEVPAVGFIVANGNNNFTLMAGSGQPSLNNNTQLLPLPEGMFLMAGFRIRTTTGNLDANDLFSSVAYHVEEWIEQ